MHDTHELINMLSPTLDLCEFRYEQNMTNLLNHNQTQFNDICQLMKVDEVSEPIYLIVVNK